MIPVDIEDVVDGLAAAQNLYKTCFRNVSSLGLFLKQCLEQLKNIDNSRPILQGIWRRIRKLAINLDLLSNVWQRAHYQTGLPGKGAQYSSPELEIQILGSFKGSISACEKLLSDGRYFQRSGGFMKNLCWYTQVEPEVQKLGEHIACHNIKVKFPETCCPVIRDKG